jgi:predicted MFS family arabinose efflux permease
VLGFQQLSLVNGVSFGAPVSVLNDMIYRVPLQDSLGRRPVLLLSTLVCLAANLWRALSQDYRSFMWASVLNGIGAGPAEVLLRLSVWNKSVG